jgi:FkbM family methyltransferase
MRKIPDWIRIPALRLVAWVVSVPRVRTTIKRLRARHLMSESVSRHLPLRGEIPISLPWSPPFLMRSDPRNALVRRLYFSPEGCDEPETFAVFVDLIDKAEVFIDVGANQGLFTLIATARNPELRVHAFEPNPNVTKLIRGHVSANNLENRVTVYSDVVADQTGEIEFRVPRSPNAGNGALAVLSGLCDADADTVSCPAVRLDDVLASEWVDVIKIDVEGAEGRVIEGAQQTLRRTKAVIVLEVLEPHDYAYAERLLSDLGYHFYHLSGAGPVASQAFVPDLNREYRNYLCLPGGRRPPHGAR